MITPEQGILARFVASWRDWSVSPVHNQEHSARSGKGSGHAKVAELPQMSPIICGNSGVDLGGCCGQEVPTPRIIGGSASLTSGSVIAKPPNETLSNWSRRAMQSKYRPAHCRRLRNQ